MTDRHRIACVQNGDYAAALTASRAGRAETYQAQFDTVNAFERLVAGGQSLVVAIGAKPARLARAEGTIVTVARGGPKFIPGRWRERLLARRIISELRAFRPTHLLLRLTDVVGVSVLAWAVSENVPTALIIASTLDPARPVDRRLCTLANAPNVSFVGNHLRVATESLTACGLAGGKAVAYDYAGRPTPEASPVKTLAAADGTPSILYVGILSQDKGAGDLLAANRLLRERGSRAQLTVCGDGAMSEEFKAEHLAGNLSYLGRVARERIVELTRNATVAIVPSRPAFAEGMPLTLLEALAARTPVVASAHPVFTKFFREGEGVAFFQAGNPAALADAIERMLSDPDRYAQLSHATAYAWHGAQTTTTFDDLFDRLRSEWRLVPSPRTPGEG